jgi:hypothetical protein
MRGVQATYRITPETTTYLVQDLSETDDIIYVQDAGALQEPGLASYWNQFIVYNTGDTVTYDTLYFQATAPSTGVLPTDPAYWTQVTAAANIWGVLTIDGERILYRYRDTVSNTVSGLLRGTAGTAIYSHQTDALVYNMGRGNLMPESCQNYIVTNLTNPLISGQNLGDGITTVFVAADIDVSGEDSTVQDQAVEIYVGGTRVTSGYTITDPSPVTVVFDEPPVAGSEVLILVRRAHTWYNLGTPDLPLNDTDTLCARFLQGR